MDLKVLIIIIIKTLRVDSEKYYYIDSYFISSCIKNYEVYMKNLRF